MSFVRNILMVAAQMIWQSSMKKQNQSTARVQNSKIWLPLKWKKKNLMKRLSRVVRFRIKKKERSLSSSSNTESEDSLDSKSSLSSYSTSSSSSSSSSHTWFHKKKKKNNQKRNKYRDLEDNLYGQYNKFASGQKSDRKDKVLKETTAGFKPYPKRGSSTTKS